MYQKIQRQIAAGVWSSFLSHSFQKIIIKIKSWNKKTDW
jgi:hypothetical protein